MPGNPHPTPFKKTGADANPNGRPKKEWTWSGLLEAVGEEIETKSGKQFKHLVSKRMWVDAVNGSLGAQKEIMNRMEGMPQQETKQTGTVRVIIEKYGSGNKRVSSTETGDGTENS